ncbi:unnamed protein product [Caenorhabditis angaria]|uniref:C-type lectin domain-containing protein n=1 Tax=Caenorhabditis angaria TaxID=860376 RepID=A0A9P1N547_9PELO|nr:unnamed protein product [Caenorhabditis angaria]
MLIFFGEIGPNMNCTKYSTVVWDTCITNCDNNANCFFAYSTPTVSCNTCGYGGFKGITYSSEKTNYTLALKSHSTNCSYNLEMLNLQKFDVLKPCIGNYLVHIRGNNVICTQRLYYTYTNKPTAMNFCTQKSYGYGGQLIGLDTDENRVGASSTTSTALATTSSIWIGLELKNSVWTWTDPWMIGPGSIKWASGHPITGNTCASLQFGTGLLQSDKCSAATCTSQYCPNTVLCGFIMQ